MEMTVADRRKTESKAECAERKTGEGINLSNECSEPRPASLQRSAEEEMRGWRKTLNPKEHAKLDDKASPWARNGGILKLPKRRTKTARRNEQLRKEREACLRAAQANYEQRRSDVWKIVKSRAA